VYKNIIFIATRRELRKMSTSWHPQSFHLAMVPHQQQKELETSSAPIQITFYCDKKNRLFHLPLSSAKTTRILKGRATNKSSQTMKLKSALGFSSASNGEERRIS
jgi:hypothetical protein